MANTYSADDPRRKASAGRLRKLNGDSAFNPLAALSASERADYTTFKKAGYKRTEALAAIGRADLLA
jgi:hypothetical protein